MSIPSSLVIGLDFGSDSVRALLVDAVSGESLKEAVSPYTRWGQGRYSNAALNQFRQHPLDYLEGMEKVIKKVLEGMDGSLVKGIGIDTTGSTIAPVDEKGTPLALLPEFSEDPDAMFFLWKDHTALAEADLINEKCALWAASGKEDFRMYEGGTYSCEWFWSKALYILRSQSPAARKVYSFVEHCDWMAGVLTGNTDPLTMKRSRCASGHKAFWHEDWGGLPPEEFFAFVDPLLAPYRSRISRESFTAETPAGSLTQEWAEKLGLSPECKVACGLLDCHAGAVGAGIRPGMLVKVFGTSTCDLLVAEKLHKCIPGICGQVNGSILPSFVGLEAGQASFGDVYNWFRNFLKSAGSNITFEELEKEASLLPVDGKNSLLSLDTFNGRRSPYANARIKGGLFGLTLGTTVPMVYKALVEGTCCGARRIVERFKEEDLQVDSILAVGGIAVKSPFVMQTCADLLQMEIHVTDSKESCALGSAVFAAVCAGIYPDTETASSKMKCGVAKIYTPRKELKKEYDLLYNRYLRCASFMEALS